MPAEVTRYVPPPVQCMLWGKAGGRCEFSGCNKPLWKSSVTQEEVNIAQKAHIYAFSEDGSRGHADIPPEKLNSLSNLILVCHECHQKIDQKSDGGRYTVELLQEWKAEHEYRIEVVTGIAENKKSHVVLYGAKIGQHDSPLLFKPTAEALFPERYPAEDRAIILGRADSFAEDHDTHFYAQETQGLIGKFNQRIRERLADGSIQHLSIFAMAPQPLLILLGSMLTEIPVADLYQLHRIPKTWRWLDDAPADFTFKVDKPQVVSGPPALIISLSATITDDRIHAVLGANVTIWRMTIPTPDQDFLRSQAQLETFNRTIRPLLNEIKAMHGQNAVLHLFPAVPVAIAVELGRVRQPKADMVWRIYDQVNHRGGFIHALDIPGNAI